MSFSMLIEASARVDNLPVSISTVLMAEALQYRSGTTDQIKCSCTDPTPAELDKSGALSAG
ncbi:hypothetical protein [Enterobacter kobei]|uniref:hypothetical protein n=1 Tax=Enterobacter kobei TaxID=208224 RepID=UPI003890F1A0